MSKPELRLAYEVGMKYAARLIDVIQPACSRVRIAGSLRRHKRDIGDIEVCCIPAAHSDMFDAPVYDAFEVKKLLRQAGYRFEVAGELYIKAFAGGVQHDIFLTTPEKWGVIFMQRTGCAEFSTKMVTQRNKGGVLPSHLRVKDGRVWSGEQALDTPEEVDYFGLTWLKWIEPEDRTSEEAQRLTIRLRRGGGVTLKDKLVRNEI
jgi:DNA polymerase/3'-5' exonuclease PolX